MADPNMREINRLKAAMLLILHDVANIEKLNWKHEKMITELIKAFAKNLCQYTANISLISNV